MNIRIIDIEEFTAIDGLTIDVRSPEEYYKGHMPHSLNIPLFNNTERAIVGKKYKNAGRKQAVIEGLLIIEEKLDKLIEELYLAIETHSLKKIQEVKSNQIKIYCARGGMRSQSVSWLLKRLNIRTLTLKGGYKSYRNNVLKNFMIKRNIVLIGGKTGTGKTKLLNLMKMKGKQIIDLESLANHRGSSFGGLGMDVQPTNEQFENLLAYELCKFNVKEKIYLEAESANIGKCRIPHELFIQMKECPRIEIRRSIDYRLNELIKTYSGYPKEMLKDSVKRISKRLGPQRTEIAIKSIDCEDWEEVCKAVLNYYDKCYSHELNNKKGNLYYIDGNNQEDETILKLILDARN